MMTTEWQHPATDKSNNIGRTKNFVSFKIVLELSLQADLDNLYILTLWNFIRTMRDFYSHDFYFIVN